MKAAVKSILQQRNHKSLIIAGVIGLSVFVLMLWLSYRVALDRVQVTVDGQTIEYQTLKNTVSKVLAEKEIYLKQGDLVMPGLDTPVVEGLHIAITRSFPVTIKTPVRTFTLYTVGPNVSDVLNAAKVKYDTDDKVIPGLSEKVGAGQEITVIDVQSKIITSKVQLGFGTEYRRDNSLEKGITKVLKQGENGLAERREKVVYENGRERKRIILSQKVLKPKVNTIIALGIRPILRVLETSRGSYRYLEMKLMDATAYSPGPESCGKYAKYGVTYTGKKAGFGIVAVDRRVIPLGAKLYIEGYGRAEAGDIGSAIKGNRIDLCYETYREAVMFGRKKVKVYILAE